ncbi:hypothetical protein JCGZ_14737 [Jatropha curcas]|uniref:AAA+ ATPase domain-containing protein n=1 Tax=Jatropha curcas TaxID=180498 RepID=A0A067KL44_JATCU|nr:AAA-ATPase At3g50940 [Jatropha curcas]KDP32534.1 hypothetical protein JCGZ_14737 [Jatropha curcas]
MISYLKTQTSAKLLTTVASVAASAILIPKFLSILKCSPHFSSQQSSIVIEDDQEYGALNEEFRAVEIYLGTKLSSSFKRLRVIRDRDMKKPVFALNINEEVTDVFENVQVKWRLVFRHVEASQYRREYYIRYYELTFEKKNEDKVLNCYLPYIYKLSKTIIDECKEIRLYQVEYDCGGVSEYPFEFDHPITFETLAIDSEIKAMVANDLNRFINGEECYRSNGKGWRRSYLLYGPPGTGKSSLIAAMANQLNYDIYDFDLSKLFEHNPEFLRSLICDSSSKSLLVVEDIDCSIQQQNQESEDKSANNGKTLVKLMELIDEAWSNCGGGQVLVLTTSNKEIISELLKPSSLIDMQINMSYCTITAFNQLVFNHFGIRHHMIYKEIEELLQKVEVSIAEVAVELMKSLDAEVSLQGLVKFLHYKLAEQDKY